LLWDLSPALEHRGRMRHCLVLAPTDHGQDSLLGYLSRHRLWRGTAPVRKLEPNTSKRHQSPWISLPLRIHLRQDPIACLVNLVAPPFYSQEHFVDCFPIVDGVLVVVDAAEGFTHEFRTSFEEAVRYGLQPILFFNKLDKLLSLEPDDELCYRRLVAMIDELNDLLENSPQNLRQLSDSNGNILFGRGSLSVKDSIGGWGFTLDSFLAIQAAHKDWSEEQVARLRLRLWGDHFYTGRGWGVSGTRGFCKLVLQPLREIYAMLEIGDADSMAKLAALGVVPGEGLTGNAWKQSAMESWLPLVDLLLGAVAQTVPPPRDLPEDSVFYCARCLKTADGLSLAFGRDVPRQSLQPDTPLLVAGEAANISSEWLLNGPDAVDISSVKVAKVALRGVVMHSPPEDGACALIPQS